jgi:parallel beta-helix repeat protein
LLQKKLTIGVVVLFLSTSVIPNGTADYNRIHCKIENGSLSGYVNDSFFYPIKGAIVSIKCGGLHIQNTSDSNGFYYIDNIPIVDCYWNVSASKKGYETFWVEMSIDINSTYDFVLTSSNKILNVGGNGPNNYSRIQDAIDNASDGDTIFVYSGTYSENLEITVSIVLVGECKDTTIIDGSNQDTVVDIKQPHVQVRGFTIVNSGTGFHQAGISACTDENDILDTIISNNSIGVLVAYYHLNNKITYCYFHNNTEGIFIEKNSQAGSGQTHIHHNIIEENTNGIHVDLTSDTVIEENILSQNKIGIYIENSGGIIITGNIIEKNNIGLRCKGTAANTIEYNTFLWNKANTDIADAHSILNLNDYSIFKKNYWNASRYLPKIVVGELGIPWIVIPFVRYIPWAYIDWRPAQEPYDILTEVGIC